jgi:hypothetical protein
VSRDFVAEMAEAFARHKEIEMAKKPVKKKVKKAAKAAVAVKPAKSSKKR